MARVFGKLTDAAGKTWHMVSEQGVKASYGARFMVMFPGAMMELARDRTASTACLPVFVWATENLSVETWGMLAQVRVGEELGLGASTVGRALADLEARGFLERRGSGPRQQWRITPKGVWMGTAAAYHREKRKRGENPAGVRLAVDNDVSAPA